jgi:hypothetical protein
LFDLPFIIALIGMIAAYIGMAVIGLPVFVVLTRRGWTAWWTATAAGAAAGVANAYLALVCILVLARASEPSSEPLLKTAFDWPLLAVSAFAGALVSSTLWLIARPDRA